MLTRSLRAFAVTLLVVAALFSGSGLALAQGSGSDNIVDTLSGMGSYVTLTSALVEKGVAETLADGEYTLFAPADSAWQALSVADRIKLYRNAQTLTDTLLHHVVEGSVSLADLTDGAVLTTLLGDTLTVTHSGSRVLVNGVEITSADIAANNGVIHSVSALLPVDGSGMTEPAATATEEEAATEEAATEEAATEEAATEEAATEEAATEEATTEETATEEAAAEETATEEAATEEAATEEAATEETAAEETAAEEVAESAEVATEEAAAPESLPETGAESSTLALFATAVATLLALGAFAFATRSRA